MKIAPRIVRTAYYRFRREWMELPAWSQLAVHSRMKDASLAIVGNAGYLAELHQGRQIDSCDLVLRMNNFRTQGFERQVGERCDIFLSAFFHDVDLTRPELRRPMIIVSSIPANFRKLPDKKIHTRGGEWITAGLIAMGQRRAYVPDVADFARRIQLIGRYPTTGAMAIFLALEQFLPVCRNVYITGFSFFEGTSHYFSRQQIVPRNHDIDQERALLRDLLTPAIAGGRVALDPIMREHLFRDADEKLIREAA